MGAAVGIDLGTTNTVVAVCEGGETRVLLDEQGASLLPSVVSFHPNGTTLVGREARKRRVIDAPNTIFSVKRLIGRQWGSPEVEKAKEAFPFALREGPKKSIQVQARGKDYPLQGISAMVVARAKEVAEKALGTKVEKAVVTVPANFNDLQRSATRKAAREAGLDVLRILNEPTAAALAYGMGSTASERLAVYDFGGGTFDLTLLDVSDNVVEVLATAGDSFLGGDDIDLAIEGQIARAIMAQTRLDPRTSVEVMALVRAAAEHLKIQLSEKETAEISLKAIGYGEGGVPIDFQFMLSRTQLERLAKPYVDRTLAVCADALRLSKLDREDFSSVILVGGSTRMPFVQERVEAFFGKQPRIDWNPDEVVAIGAAVLAAMLTGKEAKRPEMPKRAIAAPKTPSFPLPAVPEEPEVPHVLAPPEPPPPPPPPAPILPQRTIGVGAPAPSHAWAPSSQPFVEPQTGPRMDPPPAPKVPVAPSVFPVAPEGDGPLLIDVTPLTLSVEVVGGFVDRIIPRNTAVPCSRKRRFTTSMDNQRELMLRVSQGEDDRAAQNVALGELVISDLPPKRRGDLWIEVDFQLDPDGILQVRAKDEQTGREVSTSIRVGGPA
ncbi:MAG: Hsp70 family protein [Polyangiales bacterium]